MTEAAHQLIADVLADAGVAEEELAELLPIVEAVVEIEAARWTCERLDRLGSSATAVAIARKLLGDGVSLRADARSSDVNPGSLSRAQKRLDRLLGKSATPVCYDAPHE
jgi:hypothetical protein